LNKTTTLNLALKRTRTRGRGRHLDLGVCLPKLRIGAPITLGARVVVSAVVAGTYASTAREAVTEQWLFICGIAI